MWFTIAAVAGGATLGALVGRRPRHLPANRFRWWPLLAAGVLLQAAGEVTSGNTGYVLVLVSYSLLVGFTVLNLTRVGMGVVLVGLALNLVPIALDHGMPVRAPALVQSGAVDSGTSAAGLHLGAKRHLERPSDRLTVLGDAIAVPAVHEVVSFGDLVLAAGLGAAAYGLMRRRRSLRRHAARASVAVPVA